MKEQLQSVEDVWIFFSGFTYAEKFKEGYMEDFKEKAKEKYGINLECKNIHKFVIVSGEKNELYYKGELVRKLPKYAIIRRYEIYLMRQLENLGVKVFNSVQAMIDARNKMKTHQTLAKHNISMPKTIFIVPRNCYINVHYDDVVKHLGSNKFIVKWIYGCQGSNVHLVDSEEKFNELVEKYAGKILCQEYIEKSFGTDIRCYVIGGRFMGAAIRKNENGDFRSNLAKGAVALKYEHNHKVEELAVKAAKAANLDICGVDILIGDNDKYYVCEVNAIPGFNSILKTTGVGEKDLLLGLIKEKMEEESLNQVNS